MGKLEREGISSIEILVCIVYIYMFGVWCLWWFHYPGLLLHTELIVSLQVHQVYTMRCEIRAHPAELPW